MGIARTARDLNICVSLLEEKRKESVEEEKKEKGGILDNMEFSSEDEDESEEELEHTFSPLGSEEECDATIVAGTNTTSGSGKKRKVEVKMSKVLNKYREEVEESEAEEGLLFGQNKKPCWLQRIQAYSLDFHGRVTHPSNKNFQIELNKKKKKRQKKEDGEVDLGHVLGNGEIVLQFGKVMSADECVENVSVYTLDFRFPLSPLQALGICLSSCDRKFGCA